MTTFVQCPQCHKLNYKGSSQCVECSCSIGLPTSQQALAIHSFASGYYEHIDEEPIYIKNRKQLLAETRRRGQVSLYAED